MSIPAKWGPEFLVNTFAASDQTEPVVTALTNGRFVVAWTDDSHTLGDGSGRAVHAQIFHADGSRFGAEFLVNTTVGGSQQQPAVLALPDGGFRVIWEHRVGSDSDLYAQVFNADGSRSGGEVLVNTITTGRQVDPEVTTLSDGRSVIIWKSSLDPDGQVLHGQVFTTDGQPQGGEFVLNSGTFTSVAKVVPMAEGKFMIAWHENDGSTPGTGFESDQVHTQLMNADGTTAGQILTYGFTSDGEHAPTAARLPNGHVILTWIETSDNSSRMHGLQRDENGFAVGEPFKLAPNWPGSIKNAVTTGLMDGRFALAWTYNDLAEHDVRMQVINANGTPSDEMFLVNTTKPGAQFGPSLATLADGRVVAAWTDASKSADDPSGLAVRAQIFDPRESGINFTGTPGDDERVGTGFDDTLKGSGGSDRLHGAAGDDLLIGGLGDDALDGGAGDDTAGFAHNFNDCTVMDFGAKIVVVGPDGVDTLTAIEHLAFADTTITPVDDGDPLFDTLYYLSRNPDVFQAGMNARDHYDAFGRHEGRDPNAFFDTSGYLAVNKDVAAAGVNPLEHYRHSGWHEGLDPGTHFDTTLYLLHNPDVAAAGVDPLTHYLQVGFAEGRAVWDAIGSNIVSGFDAQYYLLHNPDVAAAGADPLTHFNSFGRHEGRNPNGWFDTAGYLAHYADVAAAGVNPLEHYMLYGWQEGRDPSASFDTLAYLAANPDVAAAGINPLDHFLTFGIYEGRQAVNDGMWH